MAPVRGHGAKQMESHPRVRSPRSDDPAYVDKRKRNNLAVKMSRLKSKCKTEDMKHKVDILKKENNDLQRRIDDLNNDLSGLKNLFLKHAGNTHGVHIPPNELERLLDDTDGCQVEQAVEMLVSRVEQLQ